jgi:hypothetical protein
VRFIFGARSRYIILYCVSLFYVVFLSGAHPKRSVGDSAHYGRWPGPESAASYPADDTRGRPGADHEWPARPKQSGRTMAPRGCWPLSSSNPAVPPSQCWRGGADRLCPLLNVKAAACRNWSSRRYVYCFPRIASGRTSRPADIPQRRYARRYCRPQCLVSGHGRPLVLAVDTNVLVYAADADWQFHGPLTPPYHRLTARRPSSACAIGWREYLSGRH